MAKIRSDCVAGELGRYDYEVHYAAKEKVFEAKKYPVSLEAFTSHRGRILANSEESLKVVVRQVVEQYEKTLTNWTLYIIYKFSCNNLDHTALSAHGYQHYRKELSVDYDLVYFNQVGDREYYITKQKWDLAIEHNGPQKPEYINGDYQIRAGDKNRHRVVYTPELEQFFVGICASMETLIDRVVGVLSKPDMIKELAESNQKLIG